ncbi:hypothetical protein TNCV_617581 [Trichonephila clavipes]|nr:hypothetical protein TNCV_617581 [Trichonephila clavipes]
MGPAIKGDGTPPHKAQLWASQGRIPMLLWMSPDAFAAAIRVQLKMGLVTKNYTSPVPSHRNSTLIEPGTTAVGLDGGQA